MKPLTLFILINVGLTGPAYALKCENVFKIKANEHSRDLVTVQRGSAQKSLVEVYEPKIVKEIIEIRDGNISRPSVTYFGTEYTGEYFYHQTPFSEVFSIQIFPQGAPHSNKNEFTRGATLQIGHSTARGSLPTDYEVMKLDLERSMPGRSVDPAMLEQVVTQARTTPEILAKARARYQANLLSLPIELSTSGLNRYFWFKPDGYEAYFPARVLDIHRVNSPHQKFSFLIEYSAGQNADGTRIHRVQVLSEAEFRTIEVTASGRTREDAKEVFIESLTLDEIQTLKNAESLRLKVYGFSEPGRGPVQSNELISSPLERMNNSTHLAIKFHVLQKFGSIDDLLTHEEKRSNSYNIIDVLSRQNPNTIRTRYFNVHGLETEFIWAITESGQLKVVPSMQIGNNLKPQYLRLAAGKKIFAGGTLRLEKDGSVVIQLNGEGYQFETFGQNQRTAFEDQGPHLNQFIQNVFIQQMETRVKSVNAEPLEYWSHGQREKPSNQSENKEYNQQDFDFAQGLHTKARKNGQADLKALKAWDLENGTPLHLSEYARILQSHLKDQNIQVQWAHYVLKTNSQMPWGEIKMQYRRLAQRFHQDRNKEERAIETSKAVNDAYRVLEEFVK